MPDLEGHKAGIGEEKLRARASQNPKHKLEPKKDVLKSISILTASDLDGVGVSQKVARTLPHRAKYTHLAQKVGKLRKELGEAGAVVSLTIASWWQSEPADKGYPVLSPFKSCMRISVGSTLTWNTLEKNSGKLSLASPG